MERLKFRPFQTPTATTKLSEKRGKKGLHVMNKREEEGILLK